MPCRRFASAVLLLLALLLPVAPAVSGAREPTPLEVFRRYYKDRDPRVRRKAVEQLVDAGGGKVVTALLRAIEDEDPSVRRKAASLLHRPRTAEDEIAALVRDGLGRRAAPVRLHAARALSRCGPKAEEPLRAALTDRQSDVRVAAAYGLAVIGETSSLPPLHEALRDKDPYVRAEACSSIGRIAGPDAVGMASAVMLGDRHAVPRMSAAAILGRFPRLETVDYLARGLQQNSWSLRVAAARALGRFRDTPEDARAAAAVLVPAIVREPRRRVADALADALFYLTGIDFGAMPDRWAAWFKEVGETFVPPEREPVRRKPKAGTTRAHLLDLPLRSEHVTFVLDTSHSMTDPVRMGSKTTKKEALLKALERAISRLPDNAWLNVIVFGTDPHTFRPNLVSATRANRGKAVRFFDKRSPDGRTNIYDSVALAMADVATDTLVLVTDGAPTEGERTSRRAILAGIAEMNRYRLARIHTVEIGASNTSSRWRGFLEQIAEQTGGHYLER